MVLNRVAWVCLGVSACLEAQTPPPAPQAPPKVLRGRSATSSHALRGYLGVGVVDMSSERVKALKLPDDSGIEVTRVEENSPASKAGLQQGDVIVEINEKKIDGVEEFVGAVAESNPGTKVSLGVWRKGGKQTLSATLGSRPVPVFSMNGPDPSGWLISPPTAPMPPSVGDVWGLTGQAPRIGFEGESLTPQLADFFGVKEGVLVRTVTEKTSASKAGLKAGDVICKVNGTPVSSTREVSGIVHAARKNVTFTVMRNHKEITLNVETAENRLASPEREVL